MNAFSLKEWRMGALKVWHSSLTYFRSDLFSGKIFQSIWSKTLTKEKIYSFRISYIDFYVVISILMHF